MYCDYINHKSRFDQTYLLLYFATWKRIDIADYIVLDKPTASLNWIETGFTGVVKLSFFPESGRIIPELKNDQYRELIIGNYRVITRDIVGKLKCLVLRSAY